MLRRDFLKCFLYETESSPGAFLGFTGILGLFFFSDFFGLQVLVFVCHTAKLYKVGGVILEVGQLLVALAHKEQP